MKNLIIIVAATLSLNSFAAAPAVIPPEKVAKMSRAKLEKALRLAQEGWIMSEAAFDRATNSFARLVRESNNVSDLSQDLIGKQRTRLDADTALIESLKKQLEVANARIANLEKQRDLLQKLSGTAPKKK